MLEMRAFGVATSKSPNKPLCPICFLGLHCFGHCCGSSGFNNTTMTVYHKLNARIPSIRRLAFNEISSASVLLCATAVCFLHDHEIGTSVRLPNVHLTPPDVDLESTRSPAKSAYRHRSNLHPLPLLPT